jgi:hypothetical protein
LAPAPGHLELGCAPVALISAELVQTTDGRHGFLGRRHSVFTTKSTRFIGQEDLQKAGLILQKPIISQKLPDLVGLFCILMLDDKYAGRKFAEQMESGRGKIDM